MNRLARLSGAALFGVSLAWVLLVCLGWLFSPAGQTVILIRQLAREHPEGFNAALPLTSMRIWTLAALVVAVVPVAVAWAGWIRARRAPVDDGRLTSA
jgi:hypothetical protein